MPNVGGRTREKRRLDWNPESSQYPPIRKISDTYEDQGQSIPYYPPGSMCHHLLKDDNVNPGEPGYLEWLERNPQEKIGPCNPDLTCFDPTDTRIHEPHDPSDARFGTPGHEHEHPGVDLKLVNVPLNFDCPQIDMPGPAAGADAAYLGPTAVQIGTAVASALDFGNKQSSLIDATMPGLVGPNKLWSGNKIKHRKKLGRDHEFYSKKFEHWIEETDDNGWTPATLSNPSGTDEDKAKQVLDPRNKLFWNQQGWSKIPCIPVLYITMTPSEFQDLIEDSESVTVHKFGYKIVGCQGYEKETVDGKISLKPSTNFGYQVYSDRDLYTDFYERGQEGTGMTYKHIHSWLPNDDMTRTEWRDGDTKTFHQLKPLDPANGDQFLRTFAHSLGAQYGTDLWDAFQGNDKYFKHNSIDPSSFGTIHQYRAGDTGYGETWNFEQTFNGLGLDFRMPTPQVATQVDIKVDSFAVPKTAQQGFWKYNDGFQLTPFTWLNCRDKTSISFDTQTIKHSVSGDQQSFADMEGITKKPKGIATQPQMTPQWIRLNSLNKDLVPSRVKRMMKFEILYFCECSSTGIDLSLNPLPLFGKGLEPEPGESIIVGSSAVSDNVKKKLRNQYKLPRIFATHTDGPRAMSLYHWVSNTHPGTIKRPVWSSRMHTRICNKRKTRNKIINEVATEQTTSEETYMGFSNY